MRYVLSSGGHIAGIVNPSGPRASYEVAEDYQDSPEQWRAADRQNGSWWEDWADWSAGRAGPLGAPPPMGSDRYPRSATHPAITSGNEHLGLGFLSGVQPCRAATAAVKAARMASTGPG